MSNVLVMYANMVDGSTLNGQTYSSQLAAAPSTNVQDRVRRTKVWRTQGCWEITSLNKTIIFQETAGVNLTATIVESTYTSDATFLAAIKTALQAVGASTYTVSRDVTTNKIKIVSGGTGGGGIFKIMLSSGSFTAGDLLGYTGVLDLTGALTYTADALRIHTSEWIRFDLGTSQNPKGFAMVGTKLSGIQLSSTATIKLQGNSTDSWAAPVYNQTLTWNSDSIAQFDSAGFYPSGLRYWRIYIVDRANIDGYVEVSSVFLGEVINPSQGAVQFPVQWTEQDLSTVNEGEWGSAFGDVRMAVREITLDWKFLTKSEQESLNDFVKFYKTAYPFWIALDPNQVFSSSLQRWVLMGRFKDSPKFALDLPNQFSSTWTIREAV